MPQTNQDLQEARLIRWIILLPILGVIITSFILTNIFISSKKESHELEIQNIQQTHITNLKNTIEERIEHISLLLNNNYNQQISNSKNTIKEIIYIANAILQKIYDDNRHLDKNQLYKKINETMKEISFFKNNIGYFFIYDLEDGTSISLPSAPHLVGTSLKNLKDKKGKNLFESFGEILDQKNEGFDQWYWNKPNRERKIKKIGFIKKFEPLNIAFGTAVYLEDIKHDIAVNAKNFIKELKYEDNSYIFAINTKGTTLLHKQNSIINVKLEDLDPKIQSNVKNIIKKATTSSGAFLEYKQSEKLFKNYSQSKKISYVKHIPILDWVIGTGLYTNDLNHQIMLKRELLEQKLEDDIQTILFVSLTVTFFVVIFLLAISHKIRQILHFYASALDKKNKKLKELNFGLEEKVKIQVAKNRQKDEILFQQSKMASMGEMLGNIAHQWRQPLSSISTAASGILLQKDFGQLTDEHMNTSLKAIVRNTRVLSETIDDFRNFYNQNKIKTTITTNAFINKVLQLIDANLKNHDITVIKHVEKIEIYTLENELIQSILNILNNAKDALIEIEEENRLIFIDVYKKEDDVYIIIKDNAKGIPEKIIHKVFEPYFTTKHKSQGTGIGLYMTHEIITNHIKGSISLENSTYKYNDITYTGALFTIKLPLGKAED